MYLNARNIISLAHIVHKQVYYQVNTICLCLFMSASADPATWSMARQPYPDARPSKADALRLHYAFGQEGTPSSFPPRVPRTQLQGAAGGKGTGFWVFSD